MKTKLILIFSFFILFEFNGYSINPISAQKHFFSMTCKVDCINEQFNSEEGIRKALRFFNDMHIKRVYLESYRHGTAVPSELLKRVKLEFEKEGIQCAGCITTTQMSQTKSTNWDIATCFTDPTGRTFLKETVIRTAKIFDLIILDDFYFMDCQCDLCKAAKGERTWTQYRIEQMMEVSKAEVLGAAKSVNPNCKIIIKYPCWYEDLQERGYDIVHETALFDYSFAGTETRDGGPQTQACWYQEWLNDVSNGKCAGGWYDPLGTHPETYLEQARQTILGGAKESLLHCYDYLDTDRPGIAIYNGDEGVKYGKADAKALQQEIIGLQFLSDYISTMTPKGVLLAKKPNEKPKADAYLIGKIGLLGIPFIASGTLKDNNAYFLTAHASNFENLNKVVENCIQMHKPIILSRQIFCDLDTSIQKLFHQNFSISDKPYIICNSKGEIKQTIDPFNMNGKQLNEFRNALLISYNIQMEAPRNVSLHLFTSDHGDAEVLENFNYEPVTIKIIFNDPNNRLLKLGLPAAEKVEIKQTSKKEYLIHLAPHSLALIGE